MRVRRFFRLGPLLTLLVLCAVAYFTRALWLRPLGTSLEYNEVPAKADIAVVLAGDYSGMRVLKAAQLVRDGYAGAVLVSGPRGFYNGTEADMAIPFAADKGYPINWFIPLRNNAHSTREEASDVLDELHARNVHSFLLVTSDFHTARARRIYLARERAMGGGPSFRTVATDDRFFTLKDWWTTREGRKVVFTEWVKTVATALGM